MIDSGELDYKALAQSLCKCGQQSFNLQDLLFTPAYASGGCAVTLSSGETVYLTKSEQDSCWYAAGQVALGVLQRSTVGGKAASFGFAAGALEAAGSDVRAMGDLGAYAVALTYSANDPRRQEAERFFGEMRNQVVDMLQDPVGTLKGAASELVDSVTDKSKLYAHAAANGDYVAMGRIEGELAYEMAALVASGGAGAAATKALTKAVPKIAAAAEKGFGKSILNVPGRVQSRINLANGDSKAGWAHVLKEHFSGKDNKSQFSIEQEELRTLLQNEAVVKSPVVRTLESRDSTGQINNLYVREVKISQAIGNDKFNANKPTQFLTVVTYGFGNLVTATPGRIK